MARIPFLLSAVLIAACQSAPVPIPLSPSAAEACGLYAELIRAHFGPDTRGVPVNVFARAGPADFLSWPEATGVDEGVRAELWEQSSRNAVVEHIRCDWPALGLPAGRSTEAGRRSVHVTNPSYSADRNWAMVTLWRGERGTTCLFRREASEAWTRIRCEASHRIIVLHDPVRGPWFG